jgi:hypothetical protein
MIRFFILSALLVLSAAGTSQGKSACTEIFCGTVDYISPGDTIRKVERNKIGTPSVLPQRVDKELTLEEAIEGSNVPEHIKKELCIIDIVYYGFDSTSYIGQMVVNKKYADEIQEIFLELYRAKFPIEKVRPLIYYNFNDDSSMLDNNTSGFNYRFIKNTRKLSDHAYGRAIDINPMLNPNVKHGRVYPKGASYNPEIRGTITHNSIVTKAFKKRGWRWGGNWGRSKDYQHFYK